VDVVLAASAGLTDTQKMLLELFEDKLVGPATVTFDLARRFDWNASTVLEFQLYKACAMDAVSVILILILQRRL
jgi:hypothetical protein